MEVEPVGGGAVCLELVDLLLQGLLLPLGWGMAVVVEDNDDDDDGGGTRPEDAAGMLVVEEEEEPVALTAGSACSVMDEGREVKPSEESAPERKLGESQEDTEEEEGAAAM